MLQYPALGPLLRQTQYAFAVLFLVAFSGCTGVIEEALSNDSAAGPGTNPGTGGDAGVQCQPGLTACGFDCVLLGSSSAHCGDCESACAAGEVCTQGSCGTECTAPLAECDGQCVQLRSDSRHCGGCDRGCTEGTPCFAGACGCPEDTLICNGQCVDAGSDPAHCGDCGVACQSSELCVSGSCVPAAQGCPFTSCGTTCVDTDVSSAHCGSCDAQCSAGQACREGACECTDPEAVRCGDLCVKLEDNVDHCGECNKACSGGYPCTDGECACPQGQVLCAGSCVDPESSLEHCGECGVACPGGQTCIVGRCSGSSADECTSTPATGITLREIAVLQAGKISIMDGGAAVEARAADVVAGKAGVVRVYVDTAADFGERVLSARLTLLDGDSLEQVFHKRTVSGASVESNWNSTFNIQVPGNRITPTTQYVVEIVECGMASDPPATAPRYPEAGVAPLGARQLGNLRIQYVPLIAPNGPNPDTSAARLQVYTRYMEAMFPVASVETSVGTPLQVNTISANGDGWSQALSTLSSRHNQDNAPNDLYYYGLFQPSSSSFCSGGCVAGIGYVPSANNNARHQRVSLGLSMGTRGSAETMAHEVGHNHGRPHSPCGGVANPDNSYPHAGAQIGWWGFEMNSTLHAPNRTDIMGYCSNKWVSDYIYRLLTTRVAAINGVAALVEDVPRSTWRVALTGAYGPQWGAPLTRPTEAAGAPEPARIRDARGRVVAEITVYRTAIDHLGASSVMVPEPEPDWHALELLGEVPLSFASVDASEP